MPTSTFHFHCAPQWIDGDLRDASVDRLETRFQNHRTTTSQGGADVLVDREALLGDHRVSERRPWPSRWGDSEYAFCSEILIMNQVPIEQGKIKALAFPLGRCQIGVPEYS